jgi:hypothetical protein
MVKCLSLRQPYAELISSGMKTIEVRKWNTRFRGEFLIHVSKAIDKEACKSFNIEICSLITGAIVGSAVFYDVKLYQSKGEFIADQNKHFAYNYAHPNMDSYSLTLKDLISQFP